ncbi:hypothetical protein D554_0504 [Bordetella holmesii 30539]|uniref:HpcH/HpaI aldolase/citrate lyase family protein n=3 Tax=Bordetella holmesii TaxID=35814 RepID=A0A158M7T4_9BORD|nr:hypothetical protein D560_1018 [Bordetella holmesii ATCC 51541]EWM44444.1 hypothetical protein D556_1014 [Bordetella holmesii 41130]EXF89306.1 hypothetical protein D554_0504 [Bordetella holmesii 30539]EXX95512.1 hypothetical protein D559_2948 [Bordetella holmesii 1058]KAK78754.1 HpcH/HpaI aldolase/citrate lyase family protein [Bordetella holmesii CDC-H809-BH]KAK83555.1 HpcH/HpaI aldolase/citrate lyase family protein [Bordetella holmesii CDC-H572-BH]KAK84501.1 HpcH/HpaI aldolase/citrate lya
MLISKTRSSIWARSARARPWPSFWIPGRTTVSGIVLPKTESMAQVRHAAQTNIPIIPIVETAQGVLHLAEIAATPGVQRLAFGSLDYSLDLAMTPDTEGADLVLDHARVQMLLHGRVAGLGQPLYGVFPGIQDTAGLRAAAIRARDMGFGGLLCIHPTQVPVVHEAFLPPLADLEWAREVVRAHRDNGLAAFKLDGKMIDAPVIARARRLLVRYGHLVKITPERLAALEEQFRKRGLYLVMGARFVVVLRQLNGLIAGSAGMPFHRFLAANVVGALAWTAVWGAGPYLAADVFVPFWHWLRG